MDSIKRVRYATTIRQRSMQGAALTDAGAASFNPIKAAVWQQQHGNLDEGLLAGISDYPLRQAWPPRLGLLRAVYDALGSRPWNWARVSTDLQGFRQWLAAHEVALRQAGGFGNHRKYETLVPPGSAQGTADTVAGYVGWVSTAGGHAALLGAAQAGATPQQAFDRLYRQLAVVPRFGRTARFDYLTMLGKLGFAGLEPGSAYLNHATGPRRGARLLFGGDINAPLRTASLTTSLGQLHAHLQLPFGFQVLEDAAVQLAKESCKVYPFLGVTTSAGQATRIDAYSCCTGGAGCDPGAEAAR